MKTITSIQNPTIKELLQIQVKSKVRNKTKLFIVEGLREIDMALSSGYVLEQLFIYDQIEKANQWLNKQDFTSDKLTQVSGEVYQKIAYRENTEGIIGLFQQKSHELDVLKLSKNPLILVAEGLEKPGNIGAILRTADAAKVEAVIIANPVSDLYNPNLIRASLGGVFTNQIAIGQSEKVKSFLINHEIKIFSATLQNSNVYYKENFLQSSAIVLGSEAQGLSDIWRKTDCQAINIPMKGQLDSMNVSVATAILIFESLRQREFKQMI